MKKNFWIDYLSYITLKLLGPLIRALPLGLIPFLGRRLGELMYYFDLKHRAIAYANIKRALGHIPGSNPRLLTKEFFRIFGQNILDIFLIPLIDRQYLGKYISIEGKRHIEEAFKAGKGVIFASVHAGSWELSGIICAHLGFPFSLFVRGQQNMPRLSNLLNSYRRQRGSRIIGKENDIRQLIEVLKTNQGIGMTVDQGGKSGIPVKFFGKNASFATGAIKLALKYNTTILPVFYRRIKGLFHQVIVEPPFKIKQSGDQEKDVRDNLQELVQIFQRHIQADPKEYLWTYKIWKHSDHKDILILSDGKAGHLRQAEAAVKTLSAYLTGRGIGVSVRTIELKFKDKLSRCLLAACTYFSGKYSCQGCLGCLRRFLNKDTYGSLINAAADIVISCGSSLAAINYIISRENQAKSIVIMRPPALNFRRFDLVIMPRHDNPLQGKNIVMTEGALNLVDQEYLKEQAQELAGAINSQHPAAQFNLGLLIGGDTGDFHLDPGQLRVIIDQVKLFAKNRGAGVLVSTSRRTSPEIERLVKEEFKDSASLRFMVIASESNPAFSVGGILGSSSIVIVSPESISMVSEAASSGRQVIVFDAPLGRKHRNFLENLAAKKYIHLSRPDELGSLMDEIYVKQPQMNVLKDSDTLKQALGRIL